MSYDKRKTLKIRKKERKKGYEKKFDSCFPHQ